MPNNDPSVCRVARLSLSLSLSLKHDPPSLPPVPLTQTQTPSCLSTPITSRKVVSGLARACLTACLPVRPAV